MSMEDWEVLGSGNHQSTKNSCSEEIISFIPTGIVDVDYFNCSPPSQLHDSSLKSPDQPQFPAPTKFDPTEVAAEIEPICIISSAKENELFEVKLELSSCREIYECDSDSEDTVSEPEDPCLEDHDQEVEKEECYVGSEIKEKAWWHGFDLKIWKWRLNKEAAALGSIAAVAVATLSMLIIGNCSNVKQPSRSDKLLVSGSTKDDNICSRLKEAIPGARAAPLRGARISFCGASKDMPMAIPSFNLDDLVLIE